MEFPVVTALFVTVIIQHLVLVQSAGTYMRSRSGWTSFVGSNITLNCMYVPNNDDITDDEDVCHRIQFTFNGSNVVDDRRHTKGSDPVRDGQTNNIHCMMTIMPLEIEDSGIYGCCLTDSGTGLCPVKHSTNELVVLPVPTTAQTTVTISSTIANILSAKTTTKPRDGVQTTKGAPELLPSKETNKNPQNDAQNQQSKSSIHSTVWPLLLVITVLVVLVTLGMKYMKKRTKDAMEQRERVPERDPETILEQNPDIPEGISCVSDGVIKATTRTTRTTNQSQSYENDSDR